MKRGLILTILSSLLLIGCVGNNKNLNNHTVVWLNYDHSLLYKDENVKDGEIPIYKGEEPSKPGNEAYTYTFDGWSPEIVPAYVDATYVAHFEEQLNKYSVRWLNHDGTLLSEEQYEYGSTPIYSGEEPTKTGDKQYSYTFSGWSPQIVPVTEDKTYIAQFSSSVNEYTITWYLDREYYNCISEKYKYGEMPSFKGEITHEESNAQYIYTFSGWTPEITPVHEDKEYYPVYDKVLREYTITWRTPDFDSYETYKYGEIPVYKGETPQKPSSAQYTYRFSNWYPNIGKVVGNQIYTADFTSETRKYSITWKNWDGEILKVDSVDYGNYPNYVGETPTKPSTDQYSYTFSGWSPAISKVYGDAEYTAKYSSTVNAYTLTFDANGGRLSSYTKTIYYGNTFTLPTPTYEGYSFVGWFINDIQFLPGKWEYGYDITIKAKWNKIYSITYLLDGGINSSQNPSQYTIADEVILHNPEKTGYTFAGWTLNGNPITKIDKGTQGDLTIQANWRVNTYQVLWKNYDGTILETDAAVSYGTIPTYDGLTPQKPQTEQYYYVFVGWDHEPAEIVGNDEYIACYEEKTRSYIITWELGEDTIEETYLYGEMPIVPFDENNAPSSTENGFYTLNWITDNIDTVTGDTTYRAEWKLNTYDSILEFEDIDENSCSVTGYSMIPNDGKICIPATHEGKTVVSIGEWAFGIQNTIYETSSLKEIAMPNTIISIGGSAFANCQLLEKITFSSNLATIGESSFGACFSLTSIELPNSVVSIGYSAFAYCTSLETFSTGTGIITMNPGSLIGCSKLKNISIGSNIESIDIDFKKENYPLLQYNTYENGLYIGNQNNPYLILCDTLSNDITSISINNNCEIITTSAIYNCPNLTSITIPDSVRIIDDLAIFYNTNLREIIVDDDNPFYSSSNKALFNKDQSTLFIVPSCTSSFTIPTTVNTLSHHCFAWCSSLESITISNSITTIPYSAFFQCTSLTSVYLPNTIVAIESDAFSVCTSLYEIHFDGTSEEWNSISKATYWHYDGNALSIICSDQTIKIDD